MHITLQGGIKLDQLFTFFLNIGIVLANFKTYYNVFVVTSLRNKYLKF